MKFAQKAREVFNFGRESTRELQVGPSFWTSGDAELHVPPNLMHFELPSSVNEKPDVQHQMEKLCVKKADLSFSRLCFLGLLSGVWMVLSASCALTAAAGISPEVVQEWPIISKFVLSIFAPVAMHFIVVFGGEFFSGNCMYFCVGLLKKRVTVQQCCYNLFWVFIWNALGCVTACYFCLNLTQIFAGEQEKKFVIAMAESKAQMSWTASFLRAIPANILICTSIQMGIAARDMAGKIMVLHFPLTMYTVSGFEHCITNLVVVPLGIMYGADVVVSDWLWNNLFPATLGNFIGGGVIVGGFVSLIYSWNEEGQPLNLNVPKPLKRRASLMFEGVTSAISDTIDDTKTAMLRKVAHPDDVREIDANMHILRDIRRKVEESKNMIQSVEETSEVEADHPAQEGDKTNGARAASITSAENSTRAQC
mmetsp:Transcript_16109/g.40594  ORF Transcript_16109/g.40594 Transcript_16109/m.40594 type:complete len:423 (+) Transcript_16109:114-1382(+)